MFFIIYLLSWLHWVFVALCGCFSSYSGLSLVAASRGYSSMWYWGFSLRRLLLLLSTRL